MTDLVPALAHSRAHATLVWEFWPWMVGVSCLTAADFMRDVFMPNGAAFMTLVIAFGVAVGVLVLAHGFWIDLVLAVVQGVLLFRRFDESVRGLVVARLRSPHVRGS